MCWCCWLVGADGLMVVARYISNINYIIFGLIGISWICLKEAMPWGFNGCLSLFIISIISFIFLNRKIEFYRDALPLRGTYMFPKNLKYYLVVAWWFDGLMVLMPLAWWVDGLMARWLVGLMGWWVVGLMV